MLFTLCAASAIKNLRPSVILASGHAWGIAGAGICRGEERKLGRFGLMNVHRGNVFSILLIVASSIITFPANTQSLANKTVDGYRGIWFTLGQPYPYGDKYSGGLGTYTAKHRPLAVYAPPVDKTFFVYGGTTGEKENHLLCMIGYYDHREDVVPKPVIVHDKQGVDDPHDNPSLQIDDKGYLWVFVSGRGRHRMGYKYKSKAPYDITAFELVTEEEMTYPQPWMYDDGSMLHFFTKYTGRRELYVETSADGTHWTKDRKLAGIRAPSEQEGGHYQVSGRYGDKVVTFFNRHPAGHPDKRTDLYFLQTTDRGESWETVTGRSIGIPLTIVDGPARIFNYQVLDQNVYLKDVNFDREGNPICLYLTSAGHEPGPTNSPREFKVTYWDGTRWQTHVVCETDHNYDMGSLFIEEDRWLTVLPSHTGPQHYGAGGELVMWESVNKGKNWRIVKQLTVNSPKNHGYVRRPLKATDPFYCFWADGDPEVMSISRLYMSDSQGKVKMLPYLMEKDFEKPVLLD